MAPTGRLAPSSAAVAPLGDLNGKVLVELWDYLFKGDQMCELIRGELKSQFPGVEIIEYTEVGNIHGTDEAEVVAGIPEFLEKRGCDGAILLVAC